MFVFCWDPTLNNKEEEKREKEEEGNNLTNTERFLFVICVLLCTIAMWGF